MSFWPSACSACRATAGQLLFPIGTVYDPFVIWALDAILYGAYSGARFIFAGTPAASPVAEGGAHQATYDLVAGTGDAAARLLGALFCDRVGMGAARGIAPVVTDRKAGRSTFLRLSTRPIEQRLIGLTWPGWDEMVCAPPF